MDSKKLIYDIREQLGAISDDRYIDDRRIYFLFMNARNGLIRKIMSRNIAFNPYGLTQDYHVEVEPSTRSLVPEIVMDCQVYRSKEKIPKLIYASTYGNWVTVRTIDVIKNTIELIEKARAPWITFEFPVVYAFLDNDYLYFLTDGSTLKNAVLTGVFKDPEAVDPDSGDIPITDNVYLPARQMVVDSLRNREPEDPLNNSEPDYAKQPNRERKREDT